MDALQNQVLFGIDHRAHGELFTTAARRYHNNIALLFTTAARRHGDGIMT
jgi:hypothetical protein